ncbi:unnamed protein product [Blepharisma stoltei]|uniref:Uncharacterized protein n=1 Tax=Blepharisma stoltei TaxID=1481888 RepID=A0AAU9IJI7_9CILI|nr:unnamed protein product [Blepharisma stoltei]
MESSKQFGAHKIKIVIIGAPTVGKSSLMKRFCDGTFTFSIGPTIGLAERTINIRIHDKDILLNIWDTAGQENFRVVNKLYYKNTSGAIIVFDVTKRESFNDLDWWIKDLTDNAPPNLKNFLVGNKIDLADQRIIPTKEGQNFAKRHDMEYLETSAKEGTDVEKLFQVLAEKILEDKSALSRLSRGSDALLLQPQPKEKAKKCC